MTHLEAPRTSLISTPEGLRRTAFCGELFPVEPMLPGWPVCAECARRDASGRLGGRRFSACFRCGGVGYAEKLDPPGEACCGCGGARVVVLLPRAEVLARGHHASEVSAAQPSREFWVPARASD